MQSTANDCRSIRAAHVAESAHSGEMDGLSVSAETQADADRYINGDIDADEVVARTRARYGLS
ncbi:antitoxin VbhA family protein [Brevibacterium oceani]|uniref:antitoxin VbhA family protein n=1 Tax=Brevibacterium oceani TaxID=358099 RepID=UPI0015E6497C|nr:antitoxin VbhA family protein [Brevibacterium oceani]